MFFNLRLFLSLGALMLLVATPLHVVAQATGDHAAAALRSERNLEPLTAHTPGDRALIVAIGNYPPGVVTALGGPAEDARLMRRLAIDTLGYAPENVKVLEDAKATRQAILDAFDDWLIAGSAPGNRAFFHFSGHGYQVPDLDGDEADGLDEVLIPYDVAAGEHGALANVILDDEIGQRLDRLADRVVLATFDSCHSGTMTRSVGLPLQQQTLQQITRAPWSTARAAPLRSIVVEPPRRTEDSFVSTRASRTAVWSAVSPVQWALDDVNAAPRSGVFSNRLVRALSSQVADANGDGTVTHAELLDWLRRESREHCRKHPGSCPFGLVPTLEISDGLMLQPLDVITHARNLRPVDTQEAALQAVQGSAGARGLSLEVLANGVPATTVQVGDVNRFRVRSDTGGYLSLFSIDPPAAAGESGKVVQIYPTERSLRFNADGKIEAGKALVVPGDDAGIEFEVGPPLGRQRVIALVTADRLDLFEKMRPPTRSIEVVAPNDEGFVLTPQGSQDYLAQLAALLRKPWNLDAQQREAKWSATVLDIEVKAAR